MTTSRATRTGRPAISGIAEIPPTRTPGDVSAMDFILRVARDAMVDASLTPKEVDGLLVAPTFAGAPVTVSSMVADYLTVRPTYCDLVDLGGATAAGMVWRAATAIDAGECRAVLCILAEAPDRRAGARSVSWEGLPGAQWDRSYGPMGATSGYALAAMRHTHEYGTTDEQRASVAVDQRTNACANPASLFHGKPITIDDVLASPLVCDPLHLLEIVMPCAGATAFVVARRDVADESLHAPVELRGFGEQITHSTLASLPDVTRTGIVKSAGAAFATAGLTPRDMDLLSVYDCYTITVIITLEDAGFCAKGDGGPFVADHDLTYAGDVPCNTHGGQLSYGQAGLAGGASHITEAVVQLRGDGADRQVSDCRLAFVNGNGGILSEQCSLVLERGVVSDAMRRDLPARPAPEITGHAAPFWAAAADGRLVVQRCTECGQHQHYPRPWCTNCLSEAVEFVEGTGHGTIYTFTVVRRSAQPAFAARVPYVLAFVDLDEGVRLVTNIVDCDPATVRIGQRVRARYEVIDDEHTVVMFAPEE